MSEHNIPLENKAPEIDETDMERQRMIQRAQQRINMASSLAADFMKNQVNKYGLSSVTEAKLDQAFDLSFAIVDHANNLLRGEIEMIDSQFVDEPEEATNPENEPTGPELKLVEDESDDSD